MIHLRCRHTGQNQPLAFLFLRLFVVGGVDADGTDAVAVPGVTGFTVLVPTLRASVAWVIFPPAPNSTMFKAQSLHATR